MKILRGAPKFLDTRKGALKKLGGAPKICIPVGEGELLKNGTASKGGC